MKPEEESKQLSDVCGLFEAVLEKFPGTSSRLSSTAAIMHSHGFESVTVKFQLVLSSSMAGGEHASVSALELPGQTEPSFSDTAPSFAKRALKRQRLNPSMGARTHVDLRF